MDGLQMVSVGFRLKIILNRISLFYQSIWMYYHMSNSTKFVVKCGSLTYSCLGDKSTRMTFCETSIDTMRYSKLQALTDNELGAYLE